MIPYLTWRPEPMSMRDIDHAQRIHIRCYGQDDCTLEARLFSHRVRIPPWSDALTLGAHVQHAVKEVTESVDRELTERDYVADTLDWDLAIEVSARVMAWPAVEGITVPAMDESA